MGKFDDKLNELVNQGLDPAIAEELRDASGLRQELTTATAQANNAKSEAEQLASRLSKLEDREWRRNLSSIGVPIDPSVLARPSDIDVTDESALRQWAVNTKLIPGAPTGEAATQLQAQDAVGTLSSGSDTPPKPEDAVKAAALAAQTEEEFYKALEQLGPAT